jgi:hypothetical protein
MSELHKLFSPKIFATCLLVSMLALGTLFSTTTTTIPESLAQTDEGTQTPVDAQAPSINEIFARHGLLSSVPRPLPGEERQGQAAIILPPRDDNAMYSGMLDYSTNKPVDVIAWKILEAANTTAVPEEFGDLDDYWYSGNDVVVFTTLDSGTSGSVPFNADAIELVNLAEGDDEGPFVTSYSLRAYPLQVEPVNDLSSLSAFNVTETDSDEE